MPAITIAPSPSPAANAATSANSADVPSADSGAGDGQAGTPFATILGQQIKAPADEPATPALLNKVVLLTADTASEAPADAIAALAAMLAGIAAPQLASAAAKTEITPVSAGQAGDGESADAASSAVMIAMPVALPLSVPVAATTTPTTAATTTPTTAAAPPDTATAYDGAMPGAKTPLSAILAATPAHKAEGSAETGKPAAQDDSFETLLGAARNLQNGAGNSIAIGAAAAATATTAALARAAAAAASTISEATAVAAAHAAAAAAPATPHAAASAAAAPASVAVATPVGAEGWGHEVGEKITWMVARQESRAELVLNPPQLGRIEVSVTMHGDHANATFISANPAVRDALENALPHLRETLQNAGISLGQTQVGAESFQQSAHRNENGDNGQRRHAGEANDPATTRDALAGNSSQARLLRSGNGLVDTFA